jgi:uncharacterized protein YkwD
MRRRHARELLEAGFYQRGTHTWVVLAAPFSPPAAAQADQVQARVLALVNEARARPQRCGSQAFAAAPPLRLNPALYGVASAHAADMARYTTSATPAATAARWTAGPPAPATPGAPSARTSPPARWTPTPAVQGWINSPGHCANIMSPAFSEMGAAFVVNKESSLGIYWAQVFGARLSAPRGPASRDCPRRC